MANQTLHQTPKSPQVIAGAGAGAGELIDAPENNWKP